MFEKIDRSVLCPFFIEMKNIKSKEKYAIHCEGVISDNCYNILKNSDMNNLLKNYCCNNYKKCKHYRSVMLHKYSD